VQRVQGLGCAEHKSGHFIEKAVKRKSLSGANRILHLLLYYVRAAAEDFRRRRVFRIVIRAEETASIRLRTVQRGR